MKYCLNLTTFLNMKLIRTVAKTAAALLVLVCFSCENEQDITIGGEVLPGSSLEFKEVEIENAVNLTQVSTKRVRTNDLPYYRLGKSANTKYDLVVKPQTGDVSAIQGSKNFYKFKSAKIVLSYRFKDTTKNVGENLVAYQIKKGRQQNAEGEVRVKLHRLKQVIESNDFSVAFENRYFSDGWRNGINDLRWPWGAEDLDLIEEMSIKPSFTDDFIEVSTLGDLNTLGTPLVLSKNVEKSTSIENKTTAVSIDLSASSSLFVDFFGENKLDAETLIRKSGIDFQKEFNAFYFEVIEDQTANVLEVLPNNFLSGVEIATPVISRVEVVFDVVDEEGNSVKVKDDSGNDTDTNQEYYLFFPLTNINSSGIGEPAQTINLIANLNENDSASDSEIYLKNGVGSVALLQLFSDELLTSFFEENTINEFNKDAIISRAVLRFTAEGISESYPERLVLNRHRLPRGGSGSLFLTDFNDNISSLSLLEGNHLLKKQEVDGNTIYDIVITEHLQEIFNQNNLQSAEIQNFDMTLSIFNRDDRITAIPGFKTEGSSTQEFYMLEGSLLSDEEVKISNSNVENETSLKPKLIVKFTPTN